MKRKIQLIIAVMLAGIIILSACGAKGANATPTATPVDINAISTAAVETAFAQLTLTAPTITPTPTFTNTPAGTATFTPTSLAPTKALPTAASCAAYTYVTDVTIPDGMQLPAGTEFTKTWRVKNSGTCTWTTDFKVAFVRGEAMGGQTVTLASPVPVGQTVDLSVTLKVPDKTGKLTGVWSLVDNKGQYFGAVLFLTITVGALTPSPTGSVTVTPTLSPTTETTPTETPTNTSG